MDRCRERSRRRAKADYFEGGLVSQGQQCPPLVSLPTRPTPPASSVRDRFELDLATGQRAQEAAQRCDIVPGCGLRRVCIRRHQLRPPEAAEHRATVRGEDDVVSGDRTVEDPQLVQVRDTVGQRSHDAGRLTEGQRFECGEGVRPDPPSHQSRVSVWIDRGCKIDDARMPGCLDDLSLALHAIEPGRRRRPLHDDDGAIVSELERRVGQWVHERGVVSERAMRATLEDNMKNVEII